MRLLFFRCSVRPSTWRCWYLGMGWEPTLLLLVRVKVRVAFFFLRFAVLYPYFLLVQWLLFEL